MLDARLVDARPATRLPAVGDSDYAAPRHAPAARQAPYEAAAARHLARYLAGWADADVTQIAAAVAADYRFEDPLVGIFDRHTLVDYLAILKQRVGFATLRVHRRKVCFERHGGPLLPAARPIRFWRSLPETGLAGTSEIEVRAGGVCREFVCYELNLATEQLRAGRST